MPQDSTPPITNKQLAGMLKAELITTGYRKFCKEHNLDRLNVWKMVHGERNVSPRVAEILGFRKVVMWKEK